VIAPDYQKVLTGRRVPTRWEVVDTSIPNVRAIDDGIPYPAQYSEQPSPMLGIGNAGPCPQSAAARPFARYSQVIFFDVK
jgi:hypothetical protein